MLRYKIGQHVLYTESRCIKTFWKLRYLIRAYNDLYQNVYHLKQTPSIQTPQLSNSIDYMYTSAFFVCFRI
jgi:hypothetical protein